MLAVPLPSQILAAAIRLTSFLLAWVIGMGVAQAQGWTHVEGEARAALPRPAPATGFASAALACEGQSWTLILAPAEQADPSPLKGVMTLLVGTRRFEAEAGGAEAGLAIGVPYAAIEPLRSANRLVIERSDATELVRFPLAGSRRAITAAEALCSPRELPSANRIELTPYSAYLQLAHELRREDIADFRLSTSSEPAIRAGMLEWASERHVLFAELCGSSWYYGSSGCSIVGFVAEPGEDAAGPQAWRLAYESEGGHLYSDPDRSSGGWPDLLAYPLRHGDPLRYRWTGDAYQVTRDIPVPSPLSASSDNDGVVGGLRR